MLLKSELLALDVKGFQMKNYLKTMCIKRKQLLFLKKPIPA